MLLPLKLSKCQHELVALVNNRNYILVIVLAKINTKVNSNSRWMKNKSKREKVERYLLVSR